MHDDHEDWAGIDQSRFHVKRDRFRDGRSAKGSRKRSNAEDSSFVMLFDDFLEVRSFGKIWFLDLAAFC